MFAPLFVHGSWRYAQLLLIGAILTPGRRTVYAKPKPTFVDALAAAGYPLWRERASMPSRHQHRRPRRRFVLSPPLGPTLCAKPL
jgi:hypothetical protein